MGFSKRCDTILSSVCQSEKRSQADAGEGRPMLSSGESTCFLIRLDSIYIRKRIGDSKRSILYSSHANNLKPRENQFTFF